MKKEMTLQVNSGRYTVSQTSIFASIKSCFLRSVPVVSLASFYSRLLEMHVTPLQTLHLLHAQLAFFLMLLPFEFSVLVRALFVLWFALSVCQCRRAGLK